MILFSAIDLKDGACVRLVRGGEWSQSTTFNDDPAAGRAISADAGFEWIHIVDLNGAFAGKPECGGGRRDSRRRRPSGAAWRRDPQYGHHRPLARSRRTEGYPGQQPSRTRISCDALAINIRGVSSSVSTPGKAVLLSKAETSEMKVLDLAMRFENDGVAAIVTPYRPRRRDAGS